jgi:hypothetical protein
MLETKTNKGLHEFVAKRMFGNYEGPGGLEKASVNVRGAHLPESFLSQNELSSIRKDTSGGFEDA